MKDLNSAIFGRTGPPLFLAAETRQHPTHQPIPSQASHETPSRHRMGACPAVGHPPEPTFPPEAMIQTALQPGCRALTHETRSPSLDPQAGRPANSQHTHFPCWHPPEPNFPPGHSMAASEIGVDVHLPEVGVPPTVRSGGDAAVVDVAGAHLPIDRSLKIPPASQVNDGNEQRNDADRRRRDDVQMISVVMKLCRPQCCGIYRRGWVRRLLRLKENNLQYFRATTDAAAAEACAGIATPCKSWDILRQPAHCRLLGTYEGRANSFEISVGGGSMIFSAFSQVPRACSCMCLVERCI